MRAWLASPSRVPRPLRIALALVLASMWLVGIARAGSAAPTTNSPDKLPVSPAPGDPVKSFPSSPGLIAEGYNLYESGCASCHGLALHGQRGVAPSLIGVGPGPVDFYLSTGRMPLENPRDEPLRSSPAYNRTQIDALIAYISTFGGPPAPTANPAAGDIALGLHQFTLNCAGCHQMVARGGLTINAVTPDLQQASAQQIAEAVRMGPYVMPHFDTRQIDQHQLDSIARYVLWTRKPDNAGGWGIGNIGPIPEGMVAWFIGLAALVLVARLIGERTA